MGKSSKPAYSGGVVTINGEEKASQFKNGNNIYSNYNMSDAEKQIYDYAQNSFLENLPKINVFSEDTQKNMQNTVYVTVNSINPIMTPIKIQINNVFKTFILPTLSFLIYQHYSTK